MLTKNQKKQLERILEKSFKGTFELGGGKEYRFFHGIQVAKFALKIAKKESLDLDLDALFVAALFHDVGKIEAVNEKGMIDYQSQANKNHVDIAAQKLESIIGKAIKDKDLIRKSSQIILESKEENPKLIEARVLKDADELGNFGYLQIWRTLTYAALAKLNLAEEIEYWKKEGEGSRKKLLERLRYSISKKVAKKRFEKSKKFFQELEREARGDDF